MQPERSLAPSAFPGDSGAASAETRSRLAEASREQAPEPYLRAVAALCTDRLLVPVVARATQPSAAPAGGEKETEMSVVSVRSPDGRRALLSFTGIDSLEAWDASARPVPITLDTAAEAALADGASAVLVDAAGPDPLVIDGDILARLARRHRLVALPGGQFGWMMPGDMVSTAAPASG